MARPKIYKINEQVFSGKLTQSTAYCLGLLLSDGHFNYKRGSIQYVCKASDECLIEMILRFMASTHPIKRYKIDGRDYSRISISNVKLTRTTIERFELPKQNKSLNNLFIPKAISVGLLPHFLRGVFDGDGSIWKSNGRFTCAYSGGENMMLDIKRVLAKVGISSKLVHRHGTENKNSCSLVISTHSNIEKLHVYLYGDADCFLERKHSLFSEHATAYKKHKKIHLKFNGIGERIKELYLLGRKQKMISDDLNVPFSTVRAHVQLLRARREVV